MPIIVRRCCSGVRVYRQTSFHSPQVLVCVTLYLTIPECASLGLKGVDMEWKDRVLQVRVDRRWSRAFLAGYVAVAPRTVGRWERGESEPRAMQRAVLEALERED